MSARAQLRTMPVSRPPIIRMPIRDAKLTPELPDCVPFRAGPDHYRRALERCRANLDALAEGEGVTWADLFFILTGQAAARIEAAAAATPLGGLAPADAARLCAAILRGESERLAP